MAYLKAVSYYLPNRVLSNDILNEQFPEWSVDKISSKTGIYKRHIAAVDEFSSDMAAKACEALFLEFDIDRKSIQFILLCTQSPDYFLPTTACLLQNQLGIPTNAGALDFNLGCSGFVYGLGLAKGLIDSGLVDNVLLVTSETYSKFIHPRDKSNLTIFGDAAAAAFITKDDGICSLENFVFGTDGRGGENLIVKAGGIRFPKGIIKHEEIIDEFSNVHSDENLYMNGTEIFNFTLESVPVLIKSVLEKGNLKLDEIDFHIFHQANRYMLNHLRKKIGIEESKFLVFLENCGNTVSSTIPIALSEAIKAKTIVTKQKVLLAGFGVGYSWAGCTLTFK